MEREILVNATQASDKVILEGADCTSRSIAAMDAWGHKLEINASHA
jgi:hypothetical protein